MPDRTVPASTYRLQLHAGFGFQDATEVVGYLSRLGVTHLYLSPILQAAPGSMHGYDVVDHARVSADLGGEEALLALADEAHRHDLGVIVDVVPNHMAIAAPEHLNPQLWETLRDGRAAATAHWFDVDWESGDGRIALPLLGSSASEAIDSGRLHLGDHEGEKVLVYEDHCFPLAAGTDPDAPLQNVVDRQHYRLAFWREKDSLLNYRRFFDVDTLIAIRVELDDVFEASHAKLFDLHRRGVVDGYRIDHPDGLADPPGYLERLRAAVGDAWVVVEKILEPGETLPERWLCAGTTGYDAITAVQGALAPPVGDELTRRWQAVGGEPSYRKTELAAKRQVIHELFQPEIGRLSRLAVAAAADRGETLDFASSGEGLAELLAHVAVYRAYLRPGRSAEREPLQRIEEMCAATVQARPDLAEEIAVLQRLVADTATEGVAGQELVVRFQQVCGPVMAKGVEDTTYYRWHRMVSLNEVGGDPLALDSPTRDHLHAWARRQAVEHPFGMTTLSTHDTKRSEDVRARLLAVAEDLEGWDRVTKAVLKHAGDCRVDETTAYFVAQTLIGAWPLSQQRLTDYLLKAAREAKLHTSWNDPDEDYQGHVAELAERCLAETVGSAVEAVLSANAAPIRALTLANKLVQLTMPGVPDVYQGSELVELSLVDPDNRRPVDYERRSALLRELDGRAGWPGDRDLAAEKLWVTAAALRLRRDRPELFDATAGYEALDAASPHVLGFVRGGVLATVVTRWPGLLARSGWGPAAVPLPVGDWDDLLTGRRHSVDAGAVPADDLFAGLPVALLVKDAS